MSESGESIFQRRNQPVLRSGVNRERQIDARPANNKWDEEKRERERKKKG